MSCLFWLVVGMLSTFGRGCCSPLPKEPESPGAVPGWKASDAGGVHTVGILVLKKGESSDNGILGVRVVDIIPADPCAGSTTLQRTPRVRLQFYQVPEQTLICEEVLTSGSGTSLVVGSCGDRIARRGVSAISVNAINATEQWVWFELRR